jgi:hypothetical protein
MGILLAFLVGWAAGAKAGPSGFEELVTAARTVKDSEEFAALLTIGRTHLANSLQGLSKLVSGETALPQPLDQLDPVEHQT